MIFPGDKTTQEYQRLNKGWGHSTYDDAFNLASAAGAKKLGFCHHDQERRDIDLDRMEKHFCKKSKRMRCFVVREGAAYSV